MQATPKRLTDSAWFWVYLFGAGSLIALFLIGQKADVVQEQRDRNFTRRQHSLERQTEPNPSVADEAEAEGEADFRYVDFTPFYALLGMITVVAWVVLWRQYFTRRPIPPPT